MYSRWLVASISVLDEPGYGVKPTPRVPATTAAAEPRTARAPIARPM